MIDYIIYIGWALAAAALAIFYFVKSQNESKIPKDYEGLICGRCRKPSSENELYRFEGLHIRLFKLLRMLVPTGELNQKYCFGCQKKIQRMGYLLLAILALMVLVIVLAYIYSKW